MVNDDLTLSREEFLKYAPAYAKKEALEAIDKVMNLKMQGVIHNGLYYLVLIDLVGSTKYASENGNVKMDERIQYFVTSSFDALSDINLNNVGLFIKEIGDAVLFVFQHFPDLLHWREAFEGYLEHPRGIMPPLEIRTCIHIGEVYLQGVNPLALAVSQVFKMEKSVEGGKIVLTEPAYLVAWPTLARAYRAFEQYGEVDLEGYKSKVKTYELLVNEKKDISRMIEEAID